MIPTPLKIELNNLSAQLVTLHKGLLDYQTKRSEEQDGRKYDPYELLNKAFNDPRFQWIRNISQLISQIDEMISVKNRDKLFDPEEILVELVGVLEGKNTEFIGHYTLAQVADPRITISEVDVRKAISKIRAILNPKPNKPT